MDRTFVGIRAMPTNTSMDKYFTLTGVLNDSGTLSWTGASLFDGSSNLYDVVDQSGDGNLDIGIDSWAPSSATFSGYTVEVNGNTYGVFEITSTYYVPFSLSFDDISSSFPIPGSTSTFTDNADAVNCFLSGTRIATPSGEKEIEDLRSGDLVLAADGRSIPVTWVASRRIQNLPWISQNFEPVLIEKHAIAPNIPNDDLMVSADHGIVRHGFNINASALVNDSSIRFLPLRNMPDTFTYWHIETERHEVLIANGVCAESLLVRGNRTTFDNWKEHPIQSWELEVMHEMNIPKIVSARFLPDQLREPLGIGRFLATDICGLRA